MNFKDIQDIIEKEEYFNKFAENQRAERKEQPDEVEKLINKDDVAKFANFWKDNKSLLIALENSFTMNYLKYEAKTPEAIKCAYIISYISGFFKDCYSAVYKKKPDNS